MKTLLLILGPTGVGKTELALRVAEHFGSPVISCDSRQIYRDLPVGTAAPTAEEQARVTHYFVGTHGLDSEYSAGQYERDALLLVERLFASCDTLVMTGGSMLYADAVCYGLDNLPAVPSSIRANVQRGYDEGGLRWLQTRVQQLDPDYWEMVDRSNPARLRHCIEISLTAGQPYSTLRTGIVRQRPFRIVRVALDRPRNELYRRIDQRVSQMMHDGLLREAERVYPYRRLNSLQTVGYRELFAYLDGQYDLDRAVELIRQNTRHYAKRQLTWFRRDPNIHWLNANNDYEENIHTIDALLRDARMPEE